MGSAVGGVGGGGDSEMNGAMVDDQRARPASVIKTI